MILCLIPAMYRKYFSKSMVNVYDKTLSYLHPEDDNLIQIYYAGTQEEWGNIFTAASPDDLKTE